VTILQQTLFVKANLSLVYAPDGSGSKVPSRMQDIAQMMVVVERTCMFVEKASTIGLPMRYNTQTACTYVISFAKTFSRVHNCSLQKHFSRHGDDGDSCAEIDGDSQTMLVFRI
jgi:hypothetical protein